MADNANTTDISNKLVNVAGLEHFWNKTKEDSYVTAAALTDLNDRLERYKNDIDFTPIENKIDEGVGTLSEKIDNIDLSGVAKQGDNAEATNTAIYNDTHNVAQHFGITAATEFTPMTTEEIESELTAIWNNTFGE